MPSPVPEIAPGQSLTLRLCQFSQLFCEVLSQAALAFVSEAASNKSPPIHCQTLVYLGRGQLARVRGD
jgi:hypothetical protein